MLSGEIHDLALGLQPKSYIPGTISAVIRSGFYSPADRHPRGEGRRDGDGGAVEHDPGRASPSPASPHRAARR